MRKHEPMAGLFGVGILQMLGLAIVLGCLAHGAQAAPQRAGASDDGVEICEALPGDAPAEGWIARAPPAAQPMPEQLRGRTITVAGHRRLDAGLMGANR